MRKRCEIALVAVAWAVCSGCVAVRYADYAAPSLRLDRPTNKALPERDHSAVEEAFGTWSQMTPEQKESFPTPYHVYVRTPAPGTFEGDAIIGLAFSGGGTRGTVFSVMCLQELEKLGAIVVETSSGPKRLALLDEVDYVSGVSTGVIPAAAFALTASPKCPEPLKRENWPDSLNKDVTGYALRRLALGPWRLVRTNILGLNNRRLLVGTLATQFFDGTPGRLDSGLTFGDLPERPVVLMGASIINDPGTPFIQTRLPYRYALNITPRTPWEVGIQSFETLHADPMSYTLGEAAFNSLSYPGQMRSGLVAVREDRPWVTEGLPEEAATRMRRARLQPGYAGTYEVKDGGLVDNRGVDMLRRLFLSLVQDGHATRQPLIIGLDAGYLELRPPKKGPRVLRMGWFRELTASNLTTWQNCQEAYQWLAEEQSNDGLYGHVRFRMSAWTAYLPTHGTASEPTGPETQYLLKLCRDRPRIGTPERLLSVARGIRTSFRKLTEEEMDAVAIAAAFAVWLEKDALLSWVTQTHGGAPAHFETRATPLEGGEASGKGLPSESPQ